MASVIRHMIFLAVLVAYGWCLWSVYNLTPHQAFWNNLTLIMILVTAYIGAMTGWANILRVGK